MLKLLQRETHLLNDPRKFYIGSALDKRRSDKSRKSSLM